jgi:hypothetical protein
MMAIPFAALAEAASQTTTGTEVAAPDAAVAGTDSATSTGLFGRGGNGRGMDGYCLGTYGLDTSSLTDEQKAAYDGAVWRCTNRLRTRCWPIS